MSYLYGINFSNLGKLQYFISEEELALGTNVVAESLRGIEVGVVATNGKEYEKTENDPFSSILHIADETEISIHEENLLLSKTILKEIQDESNKLSLGMKITSVDYILDRTKLTIAYLADDRVDFRELLKVLASLYHCRIELRQIGPRDKAKLVGGSGLCGLPLCCSTFLNEFDGISITMAKNQMLALNIPKLSGHCGKLICCLKYEDEVYSIEKKDLPRVGLRVNYNDIVYRIASINIITKMVRLESPESIVHVPLSAIENKIIQYWTPNQPTKKVVDEKPKEEVKQEEKLETKEEVKQEEFNPVLEEQLIMARLNPNSSINVQEENTQEENNRPNKKFHKKHFHKRRHFNGNKQGNKNEEN